MPADADADKSLIIRVWDEDDGQLVTKAELYVDPSDGISTEPAVLGEAPSWGELVADRAGGSSLLRWVAPNPDAQEVWAAALREDGVRRIVVDVEETVHRTLPWEALRDTDGGTSVFSDPGRPAYRASRRAQDCTRPVNLLPRVVLVVLARNHEDERGALRAIRGGLGMHSPCPWDVVSLVTPSRAEFTRALREWRPEVLHVVGHGGHHGDGPSVEIMANDDRWTFDRGFVTDQFQFRQPAVPAPALVVLDFCVRPETSHDLIDAILGTGAPAVVSMQHQIEMALAVSFARALYSGLAMGERIDAAVAGARRKAQSAADNGVDRLLPVLTLRKRPGTVRYWSDDQYHRWMSQSVGDLTSARLLVDRQNERREVLKAMQPGAAAVTVVKGESSSGKSAVVDACALTARANGFDVIRIMPTRDVYDTKALREVLEAQIAALGGAVDEGSPGSAEGSLPTDGPDQVMSPELVRQLGEFQQSEAAPATSGAEPLGPGAGFDPWSPNRKPDRADTTSLLQQVRDQLVDLARRRPDGVTVVIDAVQSFHEMPELIETVVRPSLRPDMNVPLRIVVVALDDTFTGTLRTNESDRMSRIGVTSNPTESAAELAELFLCKDWADHPMPEAWENHREAFSQEARSIHRQIGRGDSVQVLERLRGAYHTTRSDHGLSWFPPGADP
jgi:hypothetical protein